MPIARVDINLFIADRNDWRKITLLMNACCEFFPWPKFLMSSPEKVQHFLVSPNSIKIVPNGMFFGAATGSGVLLCWGRCTKTSTFLRDPPHPSQNGFFHLIDKIADFLHNKPFFLIAPRDLRYYWASAQPCAALRS